MTKTLRIVPLVLALGLTLSAKEKRLENSSGLWDVRVLVKFGFIDATGRMAINPQFEAVGFFSEGLCPARRGPLWGYIDRAGKRPFAAVFEEAGPFQEGGARVRLAGRWGYLDLKGNRIGPTGYEQARDFFEGLAAVIRYNMGGLTDILIQDGEVTYTTSKYVGENPYAQGSIEDYKFYTEKAAVSAAELDKLLAIFRVNGFDRMEAVYGKLEEGERYYGITLSLTRGGKEKSVLFKSNPKTEAPPAFTAIEKALLDFVKDKFKK